MRSLYELRTGHLSRRLLRSQGSGLSYAQMLRILGSLGELCLFPIGLRISGLVADSEMQSSELIQDSSNARELLCPDSLPFS